MTEFDRINCSSHDAWLEQRKQGLGGSDASVIVGCNPWKNSDELWEEKLGLRQSPDISNQVAVKYGTEAEGSLRQLFKLDHPEYKVRYRNYQILKSKALPWMQASLDGELVDSKGRMGILEIKTTNILQSMQKEKWNDQIPQNYFCQLLHYFLVTGYEYAVLKAQLKSDWQGEVRLTTRHYYFERKDLEEDLEYLLDAEKRFWSYIQNKKRPPLALPQI